MTLSIIVSTFNIRELLRDCLNSLEKAKPAMKKEGYTFEVIVSG